MSHINKRRRIIHQKKRMISNLSLMACQAWTCILTVRTAVAKRTSTTGLTMNRLGQLVSSKRMDLTLMKMISIITIKTIGASIKREVAASMTPTMTLIIKTTMLQGWVSSLCSEIVCNRNRGDRAIITTLVSTVRAQTLMKIVMNRCK